MSRLRGLSVRWRKGGERVCRAWPILLTAWCLGTRSWRVGEREVGSRKMLMRVEEERK